MKFVQERKFPFRNGLIQRDNTGTTVLQGIARGTSGKLALRVSGLRIDLSRLLNRVRRAAL